MKPRNKKQEQILAMSGQLRPLTTAQKQWALTHTIDNYALKFKKGKAVCLICGHEWEAEEGMCRCPHCGAKVEVKATTQRVVRERSYFNIITAVKGFQVIRMFLMIVEFRKGMKANPGFVEIGSYWIFSPLVEQLKGDKHGHTTVVGLQRTLGHYIDSFAFGSPLEIRHDNDAFWHIANQWVYPRINVTDTIKRNGYTAFVYGAHPVTMFQQLLTNPKAETLMKAGEEGLFRYLCHHPKEVEKYWDTIKVARRAGYKIEDPQMWFDYIKILDRIGRDLHSPTLVVPKDLKAVHDEYVAKVERQRIKEQREKDRKRAEEDEAKFEELKGRYVGLVMTDGEIVVHTLNSVAEYYNEGSRQHICVGSSSYYLKENTLVFTAKIKDKTIATIEISLKDYSIIQCRAFANKGNRPKKADYHMPFLIANFAIKNGMFNLNESNRIVMAQHPTDMRMGVNCLSGYVRVVGLDPANGDVYIFVSKSRKVMKILHWEYGGYVVYYKRLEEGRFHPRIFLRQGIGFRSMKWSELVLLMEGISPKAVRRHRYEKH